MPDHPLPGISAIPIAIVGNVNLDLKTSPLPASPAILADGETSAAEIYETIGGGGANTAVAAAAMGGRVHFCGCIGGDALGDHLAWYLKHLGITTHLAAKPAPTGRSLALTWDNHHRHFISCLPSSAALTESDVDIDALVKAGCRHLYRADVWFAPWMLQEGNVGLLRQARNGGMQTSIDINWDPRWNGPHESPDVPKRIAAIRAALPQVNYVHGNEQELMRFTGTGNAKDAAAALLDAGAACVILHRGPRGSAAAARDGWIEAPAAPVSRIVSETGTGDVFTAAFLLLDHLPLAQRLTICNGIAARHLAGMPSYIGRITSD